MAKVEITLWNNNYTDILDFENASACLASIWVHSETIFLNLLKK